MEPGVYAKIPIGDLTLAEAYNQVDDPSYWDETMPTVLYHFRLTMADYERLTVKQHRLLVEFIEGLTGGNP